MKALLYARVSSKEQEKEGFSIPAQCKLLRDYAVQNRFRVVEEYVDVETAKNTGRTNFGEMVKYLRKHPGVRIILVEKTDRLYRNLKDWVTLDETERRNPSRQGRCGAVARLTLLGKIHARHQGFDG